MKDIVPPGIRDERIETIMVEANKLTFEVDQCGDGERLAICLHGFPEHSFSWRYQLPMLADLGYKAWAPNLRGYGKSSRPPFVEDYDMEYLLADVAGLIDASGCKEVVLIAHDWGAGIAWTFAMRKVRPLTRLIICNLPHPARLMSEMKGLEQLKKSWYMFFFQIPRLPEWGLGRNGAKAVGDAFRNMATLKDRFPPEVCEVYQRNASQPGALTAMINYYRAAFRSRARNGGEADVPLIEIPTLLLWGEADTALSIKTTYGTEQYVPDLTLRYLPRISHWVQQEAPDEVNAMMKAFLEDRPVPVMHWESVLTEPGKPDDAG